MLSITYWCAASQYRCVILGCPGNSGFLSGDPRLYKHLPKSILNLMPYSSTGNGGISREAQDLSELMTRWANASVASRVCSSLKKSAHARQAAATTSAYTELAEAESARSGHSVYDVLRASNAHDGMVGIPFHHNAPPVSLPLGRYSPRGVAARGRPQVGFASAVIPSIGRFDAATTGDFGGSGHMGFDRQPNFFQRAMMSSFFQNEAWIYDELNTASAGVDTTSDWTYAHAKKCIGTAAVTNTGPRTGPYKASFTGMNQRSGKLVAVVGVTSEKFDEVRGIYRELLVDRPLRQEQWDARFRAVDMVPIYDIRGQRTRNITVDKCCQFRQKLKRMVPGGDLDVWLDGGHYIARYNHAKPEAHPSAARVPALIALAVLQPDPDSLARAQAVWAPLHEVIRRRTPLIFSFPLLQAI